MVSINPWFAKSTVLLAAIVFIAIRAAHGSRSLGVRVIQSRKGKLEILLILLAALGFFAPIVWIASPVFEFSEYPLRAELLALGIAFNAVGLWLFHRSHADLGLNWSITLEVREKHQLITHGVYRCIRHPMYTALFLCSAGQMFVIPNWAVGPSYLVTFGILFAFRIRAEEKMMLDTFGKDYEEYRARTKRLLPGLW